MSKDIIEQIQEQFNYFPHKIHMYILNHFNNDREYIQDKVFKVLATLHIKTHNRWIEAGEEHNVICLYKLPKKIFNKIEQQNQDDFISTWNTVLKFIWNENPHSSPQHNYHYNHLYLLVRTHLIDDYGYFDTIDTNKLFRCNNET